MKVNSRYSIQIIQIYAPTTSHEDEEVEELYEEISKAMDKDKSHYKIIMGDFNAKVGKHQQGDGKTTGTHGLGERNERGEMLGIGSGPGVVRMERQKMKLITS